jgi:tetratricopeptide (TPR) repeat protein
MRAPRAPGPGFFGARAAQAEGPGAMGPATLTATVERAASLLGAEPAKAEQLARGVLKLAPADPRAALILASARRRQGDAAGALLILKPLAAAWPRAANTQYELGLSLAATGDAEAAAAALRRAVGVDRDHHEAWRALGDLLFRTGDAQGADAAFAEHRRAAVRDPRLRPAAEALFAGRLAEAERLLRAHLAQNPKDVDAGLLLAEARSRQDRHAEAERLLATVVALDPDFDGARLAWANALFQRQKAVPALEQAQHLLAREPSSPVYRNLMAACLALLGDFDQALPLHEGLAAEFPDQPKVLLNLAHALRTVGRQDEAVKAYRRCIALAPELGDAWWGLANLKVMRFTPQETAAMAALLDRPGLSPNDRLHIEYALGKALEDAGDFADAFAHYAEGARLRRAAQPWDPAETRAHVDRSIALFTEAFFEARKGFGAAAPDPIFIVGLPRSGSTLIEQVLSSHSEVEGTMELPDIALMAEELIRSGPYPERLADLDAERLRAMGEDYLASTRAQRRQGRPVFIDKAPGNVLHLGLIRLILPNARVIDARRHPMASGFSAFKQHFAEGQRFTYDLADLGRYYADYVRLMAHFDRVGPGRTHRVIYEDLVEDPEAEIRRLLAWCGLKFEPACLAFWETDRAVRTVSSEQVRRPIFRDGLDRWKSFAPWLGPLEAALGPTLEDWRGDAPCGGGRA